MNKYAKKSFKRQKCKALPPGILKRHAQDSHVTYSTNKANFNATNTRKIEICLISYLFYIEKNCYINIPYSRLINPSDFGTENMEKDIMFTNKIRPKIL